MPNPNDRTDGGFAADLPHLLTRRRAITALGLTGAVVLGGWAALRGGPGQAEPNLIASAADGSTCIKAPAETAGPFPADGTNTRAGQTANILTEAGVMRSDLRQSIGALTPVAAGSALVLTLDLVDVGNACTPLAGYAIYVWHCDAGGQYSIYELPDANYLRGLGVADAAGRVQFTTIYPGCYNGRWPHIHFEVFASPTAAVSGAAALLTGQFAMPLAETAAVYAADAAYGASIPNLGRQTLAGDGIFADATPEQAAAQMMTVTVGAAGIRAAAQVGVIA